MNLGKKKAKKEEVKANPFLGKNHIGALLQVIKKSSDPANQWETVPVVHGVGLNKTTTFDHKKVSFDELLGANAYVIKILNKLIDKELKSEDDE